MKPGAWLIRQICLIAFASALVSAPVIADEEFDVNVDVRWRPETERTFVPRGGATTRVEGQQYLRSRVGVEMSGSRGTRARLLVQDSRILGVPRSGNIARDSNLGVQEAFLEIGELFTPAIQLKAGRQMMSYGNQRLIGAVGWSNVGRTFDAAKLTFKNESWSLDVWGATLVQRQSGPNSSTRFYGAYGKLPSSVDVFALLDYDGRKDVLADERMLQRLTLGTYTTRKLDNGFDYMVNAAFQTGNDVFAPTDSTRAKRDISAYLVAAEVGLTGGGARKVRGAFGIDLASGDDDPSDDQHKSFNNLYYTGHKFRGFQDQFLASNPAGLMDLIGRVSFKPSADWKIGGDVHYFRTAENFASTVDPAASSSAVGYEIDIVARSTQLDHAVLELVGAMFKPDSAWAGDADGARYWGYLSIQVAVP